MKELNESMLRRAIMQRTDLTAANKLVMLAILLKVSWDTWQGVCVISELSRLAGVSERATQYAIKNLVSSGMIKKSWVKVDGKSLPSISINTLKICPQKRGAKSAGVQNMRGARSAPIGVQDLRLGGAKSAPLQQYTIYNTTNINKQEVISSEEKQFTHSMPIGSWGDNKATNHHPKLTDEMKHIIETNIRFTGHEERVRVAKKLLKIKLLKGGYYEHI